MMCEPGPAELILITIGASVSGILIAIGLVAVASIIVRNALKGLNTK